MHLSKKQISQLIRIAELTQQILVDASKAPPIATARGKASSGTRRRRTGADLVAFKKAIKAERKSGESVAELAKKHGVTPSYIYQL